MHESIVYGREPGELKHLRSRRKGKKKSIPKVAASEMGRAQTGVRAPRGLGPRTQSDRANRMDLGRPAREGESPVSESRVSAAGSRVPRDTGNLVGRCGDHPARLNTP